MRIHDHRELIGLHSCSQSRCHHMAILLGIVLRSVAKAFVAIAYHGSSSLLERMCASK